jgi:RNA ligase
VLLNEGEAMSETVRLFDLLDEDNLARHVEARTVSMVRHPTEPLRLYNYTERCQFTGAWDHESRTCRGLIVDDDGWVIARPFPKFHNLHEHGDDAAAGPLSLVPPLRIFDKLDGSLGIAYTRPSDGRLAWATRGAFVSEQAQWATAWWNDRYPNLRPADGATWLAEIVYPENRIVLDYGNRAELVHLATIDNATGVQVLTDGVWPGARAESFGSTDDIATIDRNARPDSEGYVVLSGDGITRVKLKADEYMRLHKILTGISNVTVWDMLRNGDSLDVLYEKVPDEFAQWANDTVAALTAEHAALMETVAAEVAAVDHLRADRKALAAEVVKSPNRALIFAYLDGKDAAGKAWKQIKPERAAPFTNDPNTPNDSETS